MTPSTDPASTGAALAEARRSGTKLAAKAGPAPSTQDRAYQVQDEMIAALGLPVAGWKVGATSREVQAMLKVDEPFYGPLFDRWIYPAPNRIPTPDGSMNIVEIEFAFRMAADLPPRGQSYDAAEIADAVAAVFPAIEIVDRRMTGGFDVNANWLIADGGANHAFTFGRGRADWRDFDLAATQVRISMDGKEMGTGSGAAAMGGPLKVLHWLANALNSRGKGLRAGDWVSTGVVATVFEGRLGAQIVGEFDGIGRIEAVLA
ncbi:MAG: fumarylacetoacetate hydrolase family protein [Pseudomonadota bacterium]|nr:fumarylacetoacetate hydrolase family protein [Pseudomonadota bacterium]